MYYSCQSAEIVDIATTLAAATAGGIGDAGAVELTILQQYCLCIQPACYDTSDDDVSFSGVRLCVGKLMEFNEKKETEEKMRGAN